MANLHMFVALNRELADPDQPKSGLDAESCLRSFATDEKTVRRSSPAGPTWREGARWPVRLGESRA